MNATLAPSEARRNKCTSREVKASRVIAAAAQPMRSVAVMLNS